MTILTLISMAQCPDDTLHAHPKHRGFHVFPEHLAEDIHNLAQGRVASDRFNNGGGGVFCDPCPPGRVLSRPRFSRAPSSPAPLRRSLTMLRPPPPPAVGASP